MSEEEQIRLELKRERRTMQRQELLKRLRKLQRADQPGDKAQSASRSPAMLVAH